MAFPTELIDFFFEQNEKVLSREELKKRGVDPIGKQEGYEQAVCTTADGSIIYITAHIFYEDLASIACTLPTDEYSQIFNSDQSPPLDVSNEESTEEYQDVQVSLEDPLEPESEVFNKDLDDYRLEKDRKRFLRTNELPKNKYWVKKGFCLVTKNIPSSETLNKINIWLK